VPQRRGCWPVRALGRQRLEAVVMREGGRERELACDWLACGFGLVPETALARLCGCAVDARGRVTVDAILRTSVAGVFCCGEPTAIGGLDSLLMVDAVLCLKISEWESRRVPVIGAGQSSSTVALSMAVFDIRSKARIWGKNTREQRFAAELDASSSHVNYDETGFIQRSSDSAPPRIEAVASDLVRDALKTFPTK